MSQTDDTDPVSRDPRDALFAVGHVMSDLGQRTGNAAILLLAMSGLRLLQQIIAITLIARLIGPEEYGIFALAMPGVLLAMALSNFGLPQAIIQRKHVTHQLATTLFWLNVVFGLVSTAILIGLSWSAASFFHDPRVTPVFQAASIAVLLSALAGQYIAIMRRTLRVRESEMVSLGAEFLGLGLAVIGALAGLSYWSLVVQQLTAPLVILLMLIKITGWVPSGPRHMDIRAAREALRFGGFVAGYAIIGRMTEFAGTMVTGRLFSGAEAGLFYRAHNLAVMPRLRVMTPLSAAFVPALSRLQDDPAGFAAMYRRVTSRSCMVLTPIAVIMAAGAQPLTEVLLGQKWLDVVPLMAWMSLMTLIAPVNLPLHFSLLACGRSDALFAAMVARLMAVLTGMILSGGLGIETMAMVYMLTELLFSLPVMAATAIRVTPVTLRALLQSGVLNMIYGLAVIGLLIWARPLWLDYPALIQLLVLGTLTGLLYLARVMVDPGLRGDVLRTLQRVIKGRRER